MANCKRLHRISLMAVLTGLLAGCAGVMVGQPTPVPGKGRLGVPQPTATQVGVGANPSPTAPRMNPFVAEVRPRGARPGENPYGWLENVHSKRTRQWIATENQATAKALAGIPARAWIRSRLEQPQGEANEVAVE